MPGSGVGDGLVVVAYDGSPAARQALVDAAKLLGSCRVLIVTVWEEGLAYAGPPTAMTPDALTMAPTVDPGVVLEVDHELHQHAERLSQEGVALATSLGLDAEPLALPDEGSVARTILRLVRERQPLAIVVGSRGLGGIRARLEGSTSRALLRDAPCPVLIVHEADKDARGGAAKTAPGGEGPHL